MDRKWQKTMAVFDEYERRFAVARGSKKMASFPEDREKVLAGVKKMLCWREDLMPPVAEEEIVPNAGRGEVMRVFAQMKCALKNGGC